MKRPNIKGNEVLSSIPKEWIEKIDLDLVFLVGFRGYYLDSMGEKEKNDRGIYDDAFVWFTPKGITTFNGNVDPSRYRKGYGRGKHKGMAVLNCGVWRYKKGMHRGASIHEAFRQAGKVTVTRDGIKEDYEDQGWFGINIHRGGERSTSSLGCQTVPRSQWDEFKDLGYRMLSLYDQKDFAYILIDYPQKKRKKCGFFKRIWRWLKREN